MSSSNLIQTNATCALDNWGEFYLVCFCISIHLKASAKEKNSRGRHLTGLFLGREWKERFLLTTPHTPCVFWLDITPRRGYVTVWPHRVAPNSEQYSCIPRFCTASLSCTRGATGKVQSSGSQQRALYSAPVRPVCFYGCWGTSNLAGPRSEAGAGITVQKESQAERERTKDQRNRAPIVQKCMSPATGWVFCARPPSSSERGTAKSTWNRLRVACAGTEVALED